MQRAVANEQAFERYHSSNARSRRDVDSKSFYTSYNVVRTPSERLDDMKKIIAIAVNKTNKSFARSIFAKSLYVYIKVSLLRMVEGTFQHKFRLVKKTLLCDNRRMVAFDIVTDIRGRGRTVAPPQ